MTVRPDIAALLHQGLSDRAILQRIRVDHRTVARARTELGLPKARPGRTAAPSLEAAFRARTQPVAGGHLLWLGHRDKNGALTLRFGGRNMTAQRIAFRIRTGREAKGNALSDCGYEGCVEPAHVQDAPEREQARATFAAIFGEEAAR